MTDNFQMVKKLGRVEVTFKRGGDYDQNFDISVELEYIKGYADACMDYGIWKDGQQWIGIQERTISMAIASKAVRLATVESVTINGQPYNP